MREGEDDGRRAKEWIYTRKEGGIYYTLSIIFETLPNIRRHNRFHIRNKIVPYLIWTAGLGPEADVAGDEFTAPLAFYGVAHEGPLDSD